MSEKHYYAVTVVGRDRPGIIAETTNRLAGLGLNLEDSTMTLLRGHFAMMLVCAGDAEEADIETDSELRRKLLTFVVAGGGFSGVELIAEKLAVGK